MPRLCIIEHFRLIEVRDCLDVMVMINCVKGFKVKTLGEKLDDYFTYEGLPDYNFLLRLAVKHGDVIFRLD